MIEGRKVRGEGCEARFGGGSGGGRGEVEGGRGGGGLARVHGRGVVGDGGLGELLLRDFIGDVGAGKSAAVDAEFRADGLREEGDVVLGYVDALDAGNTASVGEDMALELVADAGDELMGQVEDEDRGVGDGGGEGRVGDDVGGEGDSRKVFDVLVEGVDQMREASVGTGRAARMGSSGERTPERRRSPQRPTSAPLGRRSRGWRRHFRRRSWRWQIP